MSHIINKRKRESMGHEAPHAPAPPSSDFRASPSDHASHEFDVDYLHATGEGDMTLAQALAEHNAEQSHDLHDGTVSNGQSATDTASAALHYSMNVPVPTETSFLVQTSGEQGDRQSSAPFDLGPSSNTQQGAGEFGDFTDLEQLKDGAQQEATEASPNDSPNANKPAVGTEEWHKVRRDNHKEVERRRRENINDGINEIAKIVPGCEKNKGSILQRAVQFITQLKENESQNIEKWTLEKLLTEQAIAELSHSCDKLKEQLGRAQTEANVWRRAAERAGVQPTDEDRAAGDGASGRNEKMDM